MAAYLPMDADGDPLGHALADCCCDALTAPAPLQPPAGLDVEQLLASGALAGPYRQTRPITVTWRMRITRALRRLFHTHRSIL